MSSKGGTMIEQIAEVIKFTATTPECMADQILALLREEIGEVGNPVHPIDLDANMAYWDGFEGCHRKILALLQEDKQ